MRRSTWIAGVLALVFAAAFCQFTPDLHAQSQSQYPNTQQQQGQLQPHQKQSKAFFGEIVKAKNGKYALLINKQSGRGYYLDDQAKAEKFNGQDVKVTGTLDVASNTIHVTDIKPT